MKTGAIYARYSPGKGREKSTTIEAQMAMCRQMATQDQVWIDDSHIYIDRGISGGNIDRPNFQRMLGNIKQGNFPDYLYIKDDKRLFRDELEAGDKVEWIWSQGVEIRYCLNNFQDPRESTEAWFNQRMFHLFAELERRKKAEETYAHQQQNALAGFSNGGLPPYGYLRKEVEVSDEVGNLKQKLSWELDPQTAPAVRQAFDAYFEGKGGKQIADDLTALGYRFRRGKPMDKSSILTWFRVPFRFAGCMVYGHKNKHQGYRPREEWIIQPDCYPAIISLEEAEKAYQISVSKRGRKGQKVQYLLSGLLKCQVCGNNFQMDFDKRKPKQSFYRCGSRRRGAKLCSNSRYLNRDRLETLVLAMVSEVVLEKGHLEEYYQKCLEEYNRNQGEREEELKRLHQQLQELEQRIENATEVLMQSPNLKERFIPKIQSDEEKIRRVNTEIETRNLASAPSGVDLIGFRQEMEQALQGDQQIQKTALSSLIHRIDVTQDGQVGVEFYINTRALGNTPYGINAHKHIPFKQRIRTV